MKIVADATPLIVLAKIGFFDLYPSFILSSIFLLKFMPRRGVWRRVAGCFRSGPSQMDRGKTDTASGHLSDVQTRFGLALLGELSTIFLAKEEGREIDDLHAAFEKLLVHQVHLDRDLLNRRLHAFGLPPL